MSIRESVAPPQTLVSAARCPDTSRRPAPRGPRMLVGGRTPGAARTRAPRTCCRSRTGTGSYALHVVLLEGCVAFPLVEGPQAFGHIVHHVGHCYPRRATELGPLLESV